MTYSPTAAGQAAAGTTAAAGEEPLQGQQRKRKQQQAPARFVRARPGQQQAGPADTAAEPGSAAAAPVAATAGAGSSAGGRCAPRGSRCRDADAHSASSPTAEPGSDASKAQQGSSTPAAGDAAADAAVVIMRAAAEPGAKPGGGTATVPAAGQEGVARPQRSKQPSKHLVLPGERLSDGDDTDAVHHRTASSKPPSRLQHVSTAPTPAAGAAAAPASAQAEWPTDAQLLQAVAAAHAAHLPAGQGQVCWSVPGTAESLVGVQLQHFVLGNPISCHVGVQQVQGAAGQARLFQQVRAAFG